MTDRRPIGVFDSGLGGLTVMRAVAARLPAERLVYLGDTARVPYGTKSAPTVTRYARECAAFLCERGVKALVVACNTASSLAMDGLRALLEPRGVAVLGVIEPGAVEACRLSARGRVGVIGTASTIRSGAYPRAIASIRPDFTITSAACPLFVPLAEEGWVDPEDPVARAAALRYLEPLRAARVDTLILGCTHYPLLRGVIERALSGVALVDSGAAVAGDLARCLRRLGLEAEPDAGAIPGRDGDDDIPGEAAVASRPPTQHAEYHVTDDPARFRELGARFLGHDIEEPRLVELTGSMEPAGCVGREPGVGPARGVGHEPGAAPDWREHR